MSARKQVVFTTLSNEVPLASRIAPTLATLWRACSSMVAPAISPVAGSMGIWPEVNSRFPTDTACEYGPMAAGAFSVCVYLISMFLSFLWNKSAMCRTECRTSSTSHNRYGFIVAPAFSLVNRSAVFSRVCLSTGRSALQNIRRLILFRHRVCTANKICPPLHFSFCARI